MKKEAIYVIKRPVVTEKGTYKMNELNRYTFQVDVKATKPEIKAAIEELYKVKVDRVNTQTLKGKVRRLKYGEVEMPTVKTASVRLKAGSTIELF